MPSPGNNGRVRSALWWCLVILFAGVLCSWIVSFWHRHEWATVGQRRYALAGDHGTVQWWTTVKTEATVTADGRPGTIEVGFTSAAPPQFFGGPSRMPRVLLSPWTFHPTAEVFVGRELPTPTGGSLRFGELTTVHAVPHWLLAVLLSLPLTWHFLSWKRRRAARWRQEGKCVACGYDLRATPDRCPECGLLAIRTD